MQWLKDLLASGIVRRGVAFILGLLFLALNKKFGLELSDGEKMEITGLVATYLLGSNLKEAAVAHADAKVALGESIAAAKPVSPPSPAP